MEKIGVLGLGEIAQKAYLPVMAGLQDQYEWHLATRDATKGQQLKAKYGFTHWHQTLDDLIAVQPLAVFVHTPTKTHGAIIERLLNDGIHVYVDKPVSDDLDTVQRLYALAEAKHLLLTCGFNRRFAPFHQSLKRVGNKRTITVEKTRTKVLQRPKVAVFDLAIHAVDTGLFLLGPAKIDSIHTDIMCESRDLAQYYLTIDAKNCRVNIVTNMLSGINLEQTTVQGENKRATVINLNQMQTFQSDGIQQQFRPDWEDTLVTRGFTPLIHSFLKAVTTDMENPVSPASSILTHQICAESLKN